MARVMAEQDAPWWDLPIAAVDVETTGLDPKNDAIIEIAIVHMRAGEVEESWSSLVHPGRPIGPDAQRITGISDADLAGAPRFADVAAETAARLEGRVILAYNIAFDREFVERALNASGREWPTNATLIDPLILARGLFPDVRSHKLARIAEHLGVALEEAHRAEHDAEAAGRVLYGMRAHLPGAVSDLLELQSQLAVAYARDTASWRGGAREADPALVLMESPTTDDGSYRLGPAYRYGRDPDVDPLRFIFRRLPATGR